MKKIISIALALLMLLSSFGAWAETSVDEMQVTIEDGTYRNEFLGLGFRGEDWKYASEEEIAAAYELMKKLVTDEKTIQGIEEAGAVNILTVTAPNGIDNLVITITYLGNQNAAVYKLLGMKYVLEQQQDAIRQSLEAAGLNNISLDVGTVDIDGREMDCYRMSYSFMSILEMSALQFGYVTNQYLVTLTFTAQELSAAEDAATRLFWL